MLPETLCFSSLKSVFVKLALLVIAYFTPIAEMVIVMLIFLLLDTISGIWASLKKGEKLESHKLRKTVYKIIWYTVAVMLSWMMEKTFSLTWSNLASLVCGFICFVELKSIFENVTSITNEPVFMKILKIIKRKGSETITEIGEDNDTSTNN
jgi:phage-related holin